MTKHTPTLELRMMHSNEYDLFIDDEIEFFDVNPEVWNPIIRAVNANEGLIEAAKLALEYGDFTPVVQTTIKQAITKAEGK